jgi:cob(I)alamin adenosyltransferase
LARTVCRRAERIVLRLAHESEVNELVVKYLNRLSDYLFVLCRMMIKDLNIEEISWKPRV